MRGQVGRPGAVRALAAGVVVAAVSMAGCTGDGDDEGSVVDDGAEPAIEFRPVVRALPCDDDTPTDADETVLADGDSDQCLVVGPAEIAGADIIELTATGADSVRIVLSEAAAARLEGMLGTRVAVLVVDRVVSAPVIGTALGDTFEVPGLLPAEVEALTGA